MSENWSLVATKYGLGSKTRAMIRCPNHADAVASLSVKRTDDGDVLAHCFGACHWKDVRDALGLQFNPNAQSYRSPLPTAKERAPLPQRYIEREHEYRNLAGDVIAVKVRWVPKDFRWRVLSRDGTWLDRFPDGMSQAHLPLYGLPRAFAACREGGTVFVVEGERDCDTVNDVGLVAVTHASGASGAGSAYDTATYFPYFEPNTTFVMVPDNDSAGRKHCARLAAVLSARYTVRWLTLPGLAEHGDVSDYVTDARAFGLDDVAISDRMASMAVHAPPYLPAVHDILDLIAQKRLDNASLMDDTAPVRGPNVSFVAPNDDPVVSADVNDVAALRLERAAIMEYAGGVSRAEADAWAAVDTAAHVARVRADLTPGDVLALDATDVATASLARKLAAIQRAWR